MQEQWIPEHWWQFRMPPRESVVGICTTIVITGVVVAYCLVNI